MFLAIGNINYDYLVYTKEPPRIDDRIEAFNFVVEAGGSACNFAVAISKLRGKCAILGCVGNDGEWLIKNLKAKKVETSKVIKVPEKDSGKVFIIVDAYGHRTMIAYKGANEFLKPELIRKMNLTRYSHIHVSSKDPEFIREIFKGIRGKLDITISYDPGSTVVKRKSSKILDILASLDFLLMNKLEFEHFLKTNNILNIKDFFKRYQRLKIIFVKEGAKGSKAFCIDEICSAPAFKVPIVDTTGAGDVFNAAVLFSIKKNLSIKEALVVGNAAAAYKITKSGAQSAPSIMDLYDFLARRGFEKIASKIQEWDEND